MTEPTKYFQQHHAVEPPAIDGTAFRPYWSVRTRLNDLLRYRAISPIVWRAGIDFRRLAEIVLSEEWPAPGFQQSGSGSAGFDVAIPRRIDAIDRLHFVRQKIGGFAVDLLEAHTVDDEPWEQMGKRYGVHPKTVRQWTILALNANAAVIWLRG
jgi:hypothetical protein